MVAFTLMKQNVSKNLFSIPNILQGRTFLIDFHIFIKIFIKTTQDYSQRLLGFILVEVEHFFVLLVN